MNASDIVKAIATLGELDNVRASLGKVLNEGQQSALFRKITSDPSAFAKWILTDEGKMAVSDIVDKFTTEK